MKSINEACVSQAKAFGEMKAAIEWAFHLALNGGSRKETRAAITKANELIDALDVQTVHLFNEVNKG